MEIKDIRKWPEAEIERLLVSTAPFIRRHSAIISLGGNNQFSGVYAKLGRCKGIITARHCADDFLARPHVALVVKDVAHKLLVDTTDFEHLRIAYDETDDHPTDLSFLIIKDIILVNIIESEDHDFYDLAAFDKNILMEIVNGTCQRFNWCVVGNPNVKVEEQKKIIDGKVENVAVSVSAIIQGSFTGYELNEHAIDYITLTIGSGFEDYPNTYQGVSGGGIWYQRFITDDVNNYRAEPILAGIARSQSEQTIKDGWKVRTIRGHGLFAIYARLRKDLVDKLLAT
jgi:hypothetical protein